jgi:DNA-binding transcriptional LysR family regulator
MELRHLRYFVVVAEELKVLCNQGRRWLRDAEQIADQAREAASGNTGSLTIGFVGTAMGLQQVGVIYRPLSVPHTNLAKLMIWRKEPCPAHLTGFLGAVRQAAALLRADAAIRRACRPVPEERCCPAMTNDKLQMTDSIRC